MLIDEIEAAAAYKYDQEIGSKEALAFLNSSWWQRIKAALEAAQKLSETSVGRDGMVVAHMLARYAWAKANQA